MLKLKRQKLNPIKVIKREKVNFFLVLIFFFKEKFKELLAIFILM